MYAQQQQQYYQQQSQQQQSYQQQITLNIHKGKEPESIPLIIYRGTSNQTIIDNIRDLTNFHRFRCTKDKKGEKTIIISSLMANNSNVYIHGPPTGDENEEPTTKEQVEYLRSKYQQISDGKNILNLFKSILINIETQNEEEKKAVDDAEKKDIDGDKVEEENKENKEEDTEKKDEDETEKKDEDETEKKDEEDKEKENEEKKPTENTEENTEETEKKPGDDNENKEQKENKLPEPGDDDGTGLVPLPPKVNEMKLLFEQKEEIDPNYIKYDGKYKELVNEMELKLELVQEEIFKKFELSDDLKPIIIEQDDDDDDLNKPLEKTEEEKKMEELLKPNMTVQIAQMQQLLQMQQMALMSQLAMGGRGGGGDVPSFNPMVSIGLPGTPMVGGGVAGFLSPAVGGSQAPHLQQSTTAPAEEVKEDNSLKNAKKWFGESKVVEEDEFKTLLDFLPSKGGNVKNMELIFRASEAEYNVMDFHAKCDDVEGSLVIIKSGFGNTFGGYTTKSWKDDTKTGTWKHDEDSFIFLLNSKDDKQLPTKWDVVKEKAAKAIQGNVEYGPTFGYGYDIRIANNCGKASDSSSQLDTDDACYGAPRNDNLLGGDFYYKIEEYEVYKVDCQ